jgi:Fe(3+) dicitrate transport protein
MRTLKSTVAMVVFAGWAIHAIAQKKGTIQGAVLDRINGHPVPEATLFLDGKQKTTVGKDGSFSFSGIGPGEHHLYIIAPNYQSLLQAFQVKEGETKDLGTLTLDPDTIKLPSVLIVGEKADPFHSNHILPVEMRQIRPIMAEEALRGVPGIHVAGDVGLSQRLNVGIRGSYPRRSEKILLMEDGVPIAPAPYLAPEAYYNPPIEFIHRVEVIKGPLLIQYGPQTLFGGINYITHAPPTHSEATLRVDLGQRNYQSVYLNYGNKWDHFAARVQVLRKHFDGFRKNEESNLLGVKTTFFATPSSTHSLYAKIGYYNENSQATYSGVTPFTFRTDPTQNPFDADRLVAYRYEFALKHLWVPREQLQLTTTGYATQFVRDWTRQNTTFIPANQVKSYVGEARFNTHYNYLAAASPSEEDYVLVGKMVNGRESAIARNRIFKIGGILSDLQWSPHATIQFNMGVKYHAESFRNMELRNDSNKVAFTGIPIKDLFYTLQAASSYFLFQWQWKSLQVRTGVRYEHLNYLKEDILKEAKDPNFDGNPLYTETNAFGIFLPAFSLQYGLIQRPNHALLVVGGVYRGYNPPTAAFGFITVRESEESQPTQIKAETSWHSQLGLHWTYKQIAQVEVIGFSNWIQNYYSPGRNEAFETLGSVRINGLESSLLLSVHHWLDLPPYITLSLQNSVTLMSSQILSGTLIDSDLLKASHTTQTKEEIIGKLNASPSSFRVYGANDSILSGPFSLSDFSRITKIEYHFGEGILVQNQAPYVPAILLTSMLTMGIHQFALSLRYTYVGVQYTDFLNLVHETADGGIGRLDPYSIVDMTMSYEWTPASRLFQSCRFYLVGKNLLDQLYKASRLHRISSGIMVAGFRQIHIGMELTF